MGRKRVLVFFGVALLFMVAVVVAIRLADGSGRAATDWEPPATASSPQLKPGPPRDLVSGEELDPNTAYYRAEFEGYELYFTSQETLDAFKADPLKYVKIKVDIDVEYEK